LSYLPGSCSINSTKTKLIASSTFRAIKRNKWITEARYKSRNYETPLQRNLLSCLGVEFFSLPRVALQFHWRFLNLRCSIQLCVFNSGNNSRKLRLRCDCQFPSCALALKRITSGLLFFFLCMDSRGEIFRICT
jgi:hypothetical protein